MADPFDVSFKFDGVNRVRNQLRAAASFHADVTDPIIEKHTKSESKRLRSKAYPPKLPNQKYIRTFTLKRRFRAQRYGTAKWAVVNRTPYAVWVIKKGMQNRKLHLNRWWTLEDTLQENTPELTKKLSTGLEELLNKQSD